MTTYPNVSHVSGRILGTTRTVLLSAGFFALGTACVQSDCLSEDVTCNVLTLTAARAMRPVSSASPGGIRTSITGSCAADQTANGPIPDGEYTLSTQGRTVTVYCHDMTGTARTFLTFTRSNATGQPTANFSRYGAGPNCPSDLTTWYNRVRFLPDTLQVDITDQTFSTSTGGPKNFGPNFFSSNSYAEAADCVGGGSSTGSANIDFTGLPFTVSTAQFSVQGAGPGGSINQGATNQIVIMTGGGFCGYAGLTTGTLIQLAWQ